MANKLKKHGEHKRKNDLSISEKDQIMETIQSIQKQTEDLLKSLQKTVDENNEATLVSLPIDNKAVDMAKKVQDQGSNSKASKEDSVPAKSNIKEKSNVPKGQKIIRSRRK